MDDLFRRASERYPLRTDSADWDRLAGALDAEPELPSEKEQDRRRRRGAFWWFLLLPLAGAGYLTWRAAVHQGAPKDLTVRTETAPAAVGSGRVATGGAAAKENTLAGTPGSQANHSNKPISRREKTGSQSGPEVVVNGSGSGKEMAGRRAQIAREAARSGAKIGKQVPAAPTRIGGGRNGEVQTRQAGTGNRASGEGRTRLDLAKGNEAAAGNSGGETVLAGRTGQGPAGADEHHDLLWAALDLRRAPIGEGYNVRINAPLPVAPVIEGASQMKKGPNPTPRSGHRSHGYIGLTAAPDFSTVKFQPMKGVGTTFGLLLGYSFNDRWAIESGVSVDRKRYYTDGEYFSTSKVRLYPNQHLLNVDGTCYMWEIPVNVRYNFSTGARMRFFGTAGLSTYLMSSENYFYQYDYSSGGTVEDSHWSIKRPSQYWFTIANLSAGFEQRLGKIGNIRLEPYIRVPLSGIGTGNLPIMSAGLNIGLTRRLW